MKPLNKIESYIFRSPCSELYLVIFSLCLVSLIIGAIFLEFDKGMTTLIGVIIGWGLNMLQQLNKDWKESRNKINSLYSEIKDLHSDLTNTCDSIIRSTDLNGVPLRFTCPVYDSVFVDVAYQFTSVERQRIKNIFSRLQYYNLAISNIQPVARGTQAIQDNTVSFYNAVRSGKQAITAAHALLNNLTTSQEEEHLRIAHNEVSSFERRIQANLPN